MKNYIKKPIPVYAKLFEKGDEDGINEKGIPYVETLEGRALQANFGEHYLVQGNHNDKWLVKKEVFEDTYKEVKIFYRVCKEDTKQGLWYSQIGAFTGLIHDKFNFCTNSALKMDYDEEIVGWLSATDNLDELFKWFSKEDILELQKYGWFIYSYIAEDYRFYNKFEHYIINQNSSILFKKIII